MKLHINRSILFIRVLATIIIIYTPVNGQVSKSGNITTHIDSIITNMPEAVGNDDYLHPGTTALNTWGEVIDSLMTANYSDAHTIAGSIDYRVVLFTDNSVSPSKDYYILENNPAGTNYWGTFVINPSPDRSTLALQSPHPIKDFNTGKESFHVFKEAGARAFYISGTSRCNSSSYSSCDGTTSVCSESSEAYRLSDQAHNSDGSLQRVTERMLAANSDFIFIQLHGFEKQESDPYLIMSNGVQDDTPPTDHLANLKDNLLAEDDSLTFKIAHLDVEWDRLLGTTNTQGRYINGSGDPCETSANTNSGQFLHIEQAKVKLRETESDWDKMANAVIATFTADVLPVELIYFNTELTGEHVKLSWGTATEINNYGFEIERSSSRNIGTTPVEDWETLAFVQGNGNSNSPKSYEFTDMNPPAGNVLYRLKQIDTDGKYKYYNSTTAINIVTDISDNLISNPSEFRLFQNYPNPFNPSTTISYSIPAMHNHQGNTSSTNVSLSVYDVLGDEVETLVNEYQAAGVYSISFNGSGLSSGMYFYKLTWNNFSSTGKLLLVK